MEGFFLNGREFSQKHLVPHVFHLNGNTHGQAFLRAYLKRQVCG